MQVDLDELKRLDQAATPGPWREASGGRIVQTQHVTRDVWTIPHRGEDPSLVCHVRNHLPAIIAEIETLRSQVARLTAKANALDVDNAMLRTELEREASGL